MLGEDVTKTSKTTMHGPGASRVLVEGALNMFSVTACVELLTCKILAKRTCQDCVAARSPEWPQRVKMALIRSVQMQPRVCASPPAAKLPGIMAIWMPLTLRAKNRIIFSIINL